jgi:hypothetical protein
VWRGTIAPTGVAPVALHSAQADALKIFERGDLPRWARVRRRLYSQEIGDVAAEVAQAFRDTAVDGAIRPGTRVAIGGGSRGIDRYAEVVAAVVAEVRRRGGRPFIFPAMGSHGGATAEGQAAVLAHYGVTGAAMGAPVRASMATVHLGEAEGDVPVHFDRIAATEADLIIPVNRVKPHTDFHGEIESGLMKMIAIGMGKQKGADTFHSRGFDEFARLIPAVARFSLSRLPIGFGVALVENGLGRLARIEAISAARIEARERELLALARQWMARLPGREVDVLVIDRLGKDISGIGADSNVINRYYTGTLAVPPRIQRIIVRGLTEATEGNASGLGQADIALRRAVDAMDPLATYMNCITAKTPEGARIPLTVDTDRQALAVALACCVRIAPERARIMRIEDTKHLETMRVSEPLLEELAGEEGVEPLESPQAMAFDHAGMFID